MTKGNPTTLAIVLVTYNNESFGGVCLCLNHILCLAVMFRRTQQPLVDRALHIGKYNSHKSLRLFVVWGCHYYGIQQPK